MYAHEDDACSMEILNLDLIKLFENLVTKSRTASDIYHLDDPQQVLL